MPPKNPARSPSPSPSPATTAKKVTVPRLKPAHFERVVLKMEDDGRLVWARELTDADIEDELDAFVVDTDELMLRLHVDRAFCALNPPEFPLARLRKEVGAADNAHMKKNKGGGFTWEYGLPTQRYEDLWIDHGVDDEGAKIEGFTAIVTCFATDNRLAGFANLPVRLFREHAKKRALLWVAPEVVYVMPELRGQGYGIILGVATGTMMADLLSAVRGSCPKSWTVNSTVHADYVSGGGEAFVKQVHGAMYCRAQLHTEVFQDKVERPMLDAEW